MSVPNFSSVFRETYGIPPMEYLARIRLQNAADLLQNTDKKIIDIAEECGFFSISNFIKAFNNGMGMSPSRYRKECGGPDKADKPRRRLSPMRRFQTAWRIQREPFDLSIQNWRKTK